MAQLKKNPHLKDLYPHLVNADSLMKRSEVRGQHSVVKTWKKIVESKLAEFDEDLTEIFKVKQKSCHEKIFQSQN